MQVNTGVVSVPEVYPVCFAVRSIEEPQTVFSMVQSPELQVGDPKLDVTVEPGVTVK